MANTPNQLMPIETDISTKIFPEDFMFQLDETEVDLMVSQNAIPSRQHLGGSLPYAFTEHGVSMISAVLKTEQAVEESVQIIRAFVDMKKFFIQHAATRQSSLVIASAAKQSACFTCKPQSEAA
jgi:hypothetical protein